MRTATTPTGRTLDDVQRANQQYSDRHAPPAVRWYDEPRAYLVARLYAGQQAPTYYRATLRRTGPDEYGWTNEPAQATRIHGTRAELRAAFGPDAILIPQE